VTRQSRALAQRDSLSSSHAHPPPLTTHPILELQRTIGNQAVQRLLVSVQRTGGDIRVGPGPQTKANSRTPGKLANDYVTVTKEEFSRARDACVIIDQAGEGFDTEAEAFKRIAEIMKARSLRATKNIVVEPVAGNVANELDYYFNEINPRPGIALVETYPTTFDTTGGWGAEYLPSDAANNTARWVIHVHRGANGGLKHATVKPIENRLVRGWQSGAGTVTQHANLYKLGIKQVDTTKTHV
jgi:hypothetical protein